jgi:hypothetical protein
MAIKSKCYTLAGLVIFLSTSLWLSACLDDQDELEARNTPKTELAVTPEATDTQEADVKQEPQIIVGNVSLTMPIPMGFERVEPEELPAYKSLFGKNVDKDGVLLCAFVRKSYAGSKHGAEFDILQVNTLKKWLNSNFSADSFEEIKMFWQKNSIICDAQTVGYFIEASKARLADLSSYSYNLGMTGYSSRQISFASVNKYTNAEGEVVFVCALKTLFYSSGKILGLEYSRPVKEATEIAASIEEYMSYVNKLAPRAEATHSSPASISPAHTFSRSEEVSGLYGFYPRLEY